MKIVELSQKYKTIIDDEDFEKVNYYKWSLAQSGSKFYARRTKKIKKVNGKYIQKHTYLHRFLMDVPDHLEIDHINGDGLDNRKLNLRICSKSQNLKNKKVTPRLLRNDYKGISYFKDGLKKPWVAKISLNKKSIHIGYYETKEKAALAYNEAAKKIYGEFAALNEVNHES